MLHRPEKRIMRCGSGRSLSSRSSLGKRETLPPQERKCASLSPINRAPKENPSKMISFTTKYAKLKKQNEFEQYDLMVVKKNLQQKTKEVITMKSQLQDLQSAFLQQFAILKGLANRLDLSGEEDILGDLCIISVKNLCACDLQLIMHESAHSVGYIDCGIVGNEVLQRLATFLDVMADDIIETLINAFKSKTQKADKKNELDSDVRYAVMKIKEYVTPKLTNVFELSKKAWIDRQKIIEQKDKVEKDLVLLKQALDEANALRLEEQTKYNLQASNAQNTGCFKELENELMKERNAHNALKEVMAAADKKMRTAKSHSGVLEKQINDMNVELEETRKRLKELENMHRNKDVSVDVRIKKLTDSLKSSEKIIETLSRQRDALELRVKELHEQLRKTEHEIECKESDSKTRIKNLQGRVGDLEKQLAMSQSTNNQLEGYIQELKERLQGIKNESSSLFERQEKCLDYLPQKESVPTTKETELWEELTLTRESLERTKNDLIQNQKEKHNFLEMLNKIAKNDCGNGSEVASELLEKERRIIHLEQVIASKDKHERALVELSEKIKSEIAEVKLENKQLRLYNSFTKDIPVQDLLTEVVELQLKVDALCRERTELASVAASRALMLERHERSEMLFSSMVRARKQLVAYINGTKEPPELQAPINPMISCSLSALCDSGSDTWSALAAERARVLFLERQLLSQSLQAERNEYARTRLERQCSILQSMKK